MPRLVGSLERGGLLVYETFAVGNERFGKFVHGFGFGAPTGVGRCPLRAKLTIGPEGQIAVPPRQAESLGLAGGGDVDVVKRLLAAGYPVVAEKGYYERDSAGKVSWMGHYQFITGYDDSKRELSVQDTYLDGPNFHISYDKFVEGWRSFDYVFLVIYPLARDQQVMSLLGPLADEGAAARHALDVAGRESQSLTGIDRFFAWFNIGTGHVALQEYGEAAVAYDNAFTLYAQLQEADTRRPYRMMWYQTGPYWAYYYTGRYSDVISLADTTLKDTISAPVLEESLLWRGRAYYMTGKTDEAISDYRAALKVHPDWGPAVQALKDLGLAQ